MFFAPMLMSNSAMIQPESKIHQNNMAAVGGEFPGLDMKTTRLALPKSEIPPTPNNFPKQRLLLCYVSFATQRVSQLSYGIYSCFS